MISLKLHFKLNYIALNVPTCFAVQHVICLNWYIYMHQPVDFVTELEFYAAYDKVYTQSMDLHVGSFEWFMMHGDFYCQEF